MTCGTRNHDPQHLMPTCAATVTRQLVIETALIKAHEPGPQAAVDRKYQHCCLSFSSQTASAVMVDSPWLHLIPRPLLCVSRRHEHRRNSGSSRADGVQARCEANARALRTALRDVGVRLLTAEPAIISRPTASTCALAPVGGHEQRLCRRCSGACACWLLWQS